MDMLNLATARNKIGRRVTKTNISWVYMQRVFSFLSVVDKNLCQLVPASKPMHGSASFEYNT